MAKPRATLRLSVVIPVYNERGTIAELISRVRAVAIEKEIIIIDDGSTDGSREFLRELCSKTTSDNDDRVTALRPGRTVIDEGIRILFQERNAGKGAALRWGFKEAQGAIVIIQDADLELDPEDYHKLLEPIESGTADVVYGSRFLGEPRPGERGWHVLGNHFLTSFSNMFTRLNLTDAWTCYKVFPTKLLQQIEIQENRFGIEPELTAKIARRRWRVCEIPISYRPRTYAKGKKIGWKDGIRGAWCVIRYSLFG
jgi:glycosyltransferase involved in cell wall biosynthesis